MKNPPSRLPRTLAVLERGIQEGLHLGAQLYVVREGEVIGDTAVGEARLGVPMRQDSILLWLSSGKPITAVAIVQLTERGRLRLDDPVQSLVPEFAGAGKERITVRHLLTHTCVLRTADKCDAGRDWSQIIDCVCSAPIEAQSVPGQTAAYHPSASWYLLGEIIRRVDGRRAEQYVREEILEPWEMKDTWLALPPEEFRQYGDRLALVYHTDKQPPAPHATWNSEMDASVSRPGRNSRGPIRQLGRFYERLLDLRRGIASTARDVLLTESVREMTSRQRQGMFDDTFQQIIDWGLGFALDSKRYGRERVAYGYGRWASEEAFGHSGAQSSCGFADPIHGVVVAWACNGVPGERRHQLRAHELNSAVYEDLGLGNSIPTES